MTYKLQSVNDSDTAMNLLKKSPDIKSEVATAIHGCRIFHTMNPLVITLLELNYDYKESEYILYCDEFPDTMGMGLKLESSHINDAIPESIKIIKEETECKIETLKHVLKSFEDEKPTNELEKILRDNILVNLYNWGYKFDGFSTKYDKTPATEDCDISVDIIVELSDINPTVEKIITRLTKSLSSILPKGFIVDDYIINPNNDNDKLVRFKMKNIERVK